MRHFLDFSYFILIFLYIFAINVSNLSSTTTYGSVTIFLRYSIIASTGSVQYVSQRLFYTCAIVPNGSVPMFEHTTKTTYEDYWQKIVANLTNLTISAADYRWMYEAQLHDDRCHKMYEKFSTCFQRYTSAIKNNKPINSYLLIFGPFCEMCFHSREERKLTQLINQAPHIGETTIFTTSTSFGSDRRVRVLNDVILYPNDPDFGLDVRLAFLSGSRRTNAQILYHLFNRHFRFHQYVMLNIGRSENSVNRMCKRLMDSIVDSRLRESNTNVRIYEWHVDTNDPVEMDDQIKNIWLSVANVTRIIFVCSSGRTLLELLKQIENDRSNRDNKYGVFYLAYGEQVAKYIAEELIVWGMQRCLQYLKILVPERSCDKYEDALSTSVEDYRRQFGSDIHWLDRMSRNSQLTITFGRYYCSIYHYLSSLKDHSSTGGSKDRCYDQIGCQFAHTYRLGNQSRGSVRNKTVEFLATMVLLTYDFDKNRYIIGLKASWTEREENPIEFMSEASIFWRDGDPNISWALYTCGNTTSSYPCPLNVDDHSFEFLTIAVGLIIGFVLIFVFSFLLVYFYVRYNKRYLLRRYQLNSKDLSIKTSRWRKGDMCLGLYRKQPVIVFRVSTALDYKIMSERTFLTDLNKLANLSESSKSFVGILGFVCENRNPVEYSLIFKLGAGANLKRILRNVKIGVDLKFSLIRDLVVAMNEIHRSYLKYHGDLRTNRCVIDERFVLRVILTRMPVLRFTELKLCKKPTRRRCISKPRIPDTLWSAPELLRHEISEPSPSTDVYSFAIIMHEIVFQKGPFYVRLIQGVKHSNELKVKNTAFPKLQSHFTSPTSVRTSEDDSRSQTSENFSEDESCAEVVVVHVTQSKLRPSMPFVRKSPKFKMLEDLMERCWDENPTKRPTFMAILMDMQTYMKEQNIDVAFVTSKRLAAVSKEMIKTLFGRKAEAVNERDKSLKYLLHLMPYAYSYELATGGSAPEPDSFEDVSVYFNSITEFTSLVQKQKPMEVIDILHELFQAYDKIVKLYDVVPLHRVGSSLLLASGVPHKNALHASEIAQPALQIRYFAKNYKRVPLKLRAGIHSGAVMSGIVGKKVQQFGLFGDTVNTASRMASHGMAGEIQISEATRQLLMQSGLFKISRPVTKMIKGKSAMKTYTITGFGAYYGMLPLNRRLDDLPALKSASEPLSSAHVSPVDQTNVSPSTKKKTLTMMSKKLFSSRQGLPTTSGGEDITGRLSVISEKSLRHQTFSLRHC